MDLVTIISLLDGTLIFKLVFSFRYNWLRMTMTLVLKIGSEIGFYLAPFNGGSDCSAVALTLLFFDVAALWNGLLALIISSIEESG